VDDWELAAMRRGRATRYRESGPLLGELTADCTELVRLLGVRQSASAVRRLTRVTAQMSGLMSLTLIKLNRVEASNRWARTARLAADEAGDPAVQSRVRAQEAYTAFYGGDLPSAVDVARHSQVLAGATPCVGVALAAALEGRAHALMGRPGEAHQALAVAESTLGRLDGESISASAFGYSEAQFRFHEGNALTHLGDTTAAEHSHDRALALYSPDDFLDRALVRLDRAACLSRAGQVDAAATEASETLCGLSGPQREGLIDVRAREILAAMTAAGQPPPAVAGLGYLLTSTPDAEGST
jgi:tetratricopeptide (TPR) repeat protein